MNYREKMRAYIECPQFGNIYYGKWGALNLEQRKLIKRLLDEMDRADDYIKKLFFENEQLKDNWKQLKQWLEEEINEFDNKLVTSDRPNECAIASIALEKVVFKIQELEVEDEI